MDAGSASELAAAVAAIRERISARYPQGEAANSGIPLVDLLPVLHARDAAEAKVASIGSVNPRPGGPLNAAVQFFKRTISRGLNWFVRDQVEFNRAVLECHQATLDALNEFNRLAVDLAARATAAGEAAQRDTAATAERLTGVEAASQWNAQQLESQHLALRDEVAAREQAFWTAEARIDSAAAAALRQVEASEMALRALTAELESALSARMAAAEAAAAPLADVHQHWIIWRQEWEHKLSVNEVQFLRGLADVQAAFQQRTAQLEATFRDLTRSQHEQFTAALDRSGEAIQARLWEDMARVRLEYERLIHAELRTLRQRAALAAPAAGPAPAPLPAAGAFFDALRFADRFRGTPEYVRQSMAFYTEIFKGRQKVLDIGCGRGEFLALARESGIGARGLELSQECVALCKAQSLDVAEADLFGYLADLEPRSLDGILCAHVVEHLPPDRLPEFCSLAAQALAPGATLAIETPNPACLAIFATHFYLDPTHVRPVPAELLAFYLVEAGFGNVETRLRNDAAETLPEVAALPEEFRRRFFGALDYAILTHRL